MCLGCSHIPLLRRKLEHGEVRECARAFPFSHEEALSGFPQSLSAPEFVALATVLEDLA